MGPLLPAGIRARVRPLSLLVSSLLVMVIARVGSPRAASPFLRSGDRTSIMVAEFTGPSPHDLGTAELATVQVLENNIEMMLHLLDDWHRAGGSRADDAGGSARVGGAF